MVETYSIYGGRIMLEFDPDMHEYRVDGKVIPNITSIIGIVHKEALENWKIRKIVEYIQNNFFGVIDKDLIDEAINEPTRIVNEAGDIGGIVHNILEDYVNFRIDGGDPEYYTPKYVNVDGYPDFLRIQKNAWFNFVEWEDSHDVEWLMSEQKLYSEKHDFCGTVDALAMVNGKLTIIDFKTSNRLYNSMLVQVAGYSLAMAEQFDEHPEQIYVLHVPKTNEDRCSFKKRSGAKLKQAQNDFLACLRLYRSPNFK